MPIVKPRPPAGEGELNAIAELIQQVFQSDETTTAYRKMASMEGFDPASLPTVWDVSGAPIATVQAVPCEVSLLGAWLPAGIITMVATAEHARGQGFMRLCMEAAHQWMLDRGRPVGILYGVPEIYPKFGYRPLMPRCETRYALPDHADGPLARAALPVDAGRMADLFNQRERVRPCAVKRGDAPWIWESPSGHSSLYCLEGEAGVEGYFRIAERGADADALTVLEAACQSGCEARLIDSIHAQAAMSGKGTVALRLMPDHPLVLEIVRRVSSLEIAPVEQSVIPPQAGMLAILDPQGVLDQLAPVVEERLAGRSLHIHDGAGLDMSFNRQSSGSLHLNDPAAISQLLAGYPGVRALEQWDVISADEATLVVAEQVFPASWPRWVLAPFWDE